MPGLNETKIVVFSELVSVISKLSKDPSTKVGALILRPDLTIVSMGYNGFARGVADSDERWNNREVKHKMVIHAEENALLTAREDVRGCLMFCTHYPCSRCASKLVQAGISILIHSNEKRADHDCGLAEDILMEGVVRVYSRYVATSIF